MYGKTDTHIVLVDCNGYGSSEDVVNILEDCNILVNGCKVPSIDGYHDGIRIGTIAISQLDISKENVIKIADIISEILDDIKNKIEIKYDYYQDRVSSIVKEVFDNDSF